MSADGNWKFTINSPMGAQGGTIDIKTSGDSFTGKVQSAAFGSQDVNGSVAGNKLKWRGSITQPMPMDLDYDVTIEGDKLSGNVTAGSFGSFPISGERA
jgi:hypothetical protein